MIANRNTEQNLQQNINFKKQSMINDLSFKLFCWPSKYLPTKTLGSINHNSFSLDKKLQKLQRAKKEAGIFSNYK